MTTKIEDLISEVLESGKGIYPLPWHDNHFHEDDGIPFTTVETVDNKIVCDFDNLLNSHYVAVAANAASTLALELKRCRETVRNALDLLDMATKSLKNSWLIGNVPEILSATELLRAAMTPKEHDNDK